MSPLVICLIIVALAIVSFAWGKISTGTTAMVAALLLLLTNTIEQKVFLESFGDSTGLLIVSMFIVAEGFSRTQFIKNFAAYFTKIAKGSLTKVLAGYLFLAIVLAQFIPSNLVPFLILYPLLTATVKDMGISPSKVIFSLGLTDITALMVMPFGAGATMFAEINGYFNANGVKDVSMLITDPLKFRFPLLIILTLYLLFIAPRFAPDIPVDEIKQIGSGKVIEHAKLKPLQEKFGYIIFILVTIALLFSKQLGLPVWEITMIGALLMVVTNVLSVKEAIQAMPIEIFLLYVGSIIMAKALTLTGAGILLGKILASAVGTSSTSIWAYLLFFILPFVTTQFIFNRSAIAIFMPIVIQACIAMNINPIGPSIMVYVGALSAFMTPLSTGTVPYMMAAGGYDSRTLIKMSIFPAIICLVVSVVWASIAFPLF